MRDRIRDAFDKIHANPELKRQTAEFLAGQRTYPRRRVLPVRQLAALAVCLAVFLLGFGLFRSYYTVSAAISVDSDSSLELGINCFDRVISVEGYGEAGQALAESMDDLRHMDYASALETLLASETVQSYLEDGDFLLITVAGQNTEQQDAILQQAENDAADNPGISCRSETSGDVEAAHSAGLSFGKYRAYLELLELDPGVAPEDVSGLTMRQIRDWIERLSADTAAEDTSSSEDTAGSGSAGNGSQNAGQNGHGSGSQENGGQENAGRENAGQGNGTGNGTHSGNGNQHGKRIGAS